MESAQVRISGISGGYTFDEEPGVQPVVLWNGIWRFPGTTRWFDAAKTGFSTFQKKWRILEDRGSQIDGILGWTFGMSHQGRW